MILFNSFIPILTKTEDKPMESSIKLDMNMLLNLGELVELLLESQELEDLVPAEVDREPLETNAVRVECLLLSNPGEDGTEESILTRDAMLLLQLLLPQLVLLW